MSKNELPDREASVLITVTKRYAGNPNESRDFNNAIAQPL